MNVVGVISALIKKPHTPQLDYAHLLPISQLYFYVFAKKTLYHLGYMYVQ